MEDNKKKIPEGLLEALHRIKAEDLQYGGEIKIVDEAETAEMTVEVPLGRYEDLLENSVRFKILKTDYESRGKIDEDVAQAVMGATKNEYREKADRYFDQYWQEKEKRERLEKQVANLKAEIDGLKAKPESDQKEDQDE